jgi:hypothetical protein
LGLPGDMLWESGAWLGKTYLESCSSVASLSMQVLLCLVICDLTFSITTCIIGNLTSQLPDMRVAFFSPPSVREAIREAKRRATSFLPSAAAEDRGFLPPPLVAPAAVGGGGNLGGL